MLKYKGIFCLWIWILSFLYLINISTFSTIYLAFFSSLFSLNPFYIFLKRNPIRQIIIGMFEYILFLVIFYKYLIINKNNLFDINTIIISIIIFLIYLLFLKYILKTSFYKYYYENII